MSTHDKVIANDTFPNIRSDVNSALAAIASQEAGTSDPSAMLAYERQARTDQGLVRRRNAANSGWITDGTLAETYLLARSSNTILGQTSHLCTVIATSTFTQTFSAASTLGDGWCVGYRNDGTGIITLDPDSSEQIDGAATLDLHPGDSCLIYCTGSAFKTIGLARTKLGTPVASTSGTNIDFTGVPSWARKITITFSGVSTNGTSVLLVQIGDAGGIEASGYLGAGTDLATTSNATTGFAVAIAMAAAAVFHGSCVLTMENSTAFTWVAQSVLSRSDAGGIRIASGSKSLSAALDRVRVTTSSGDTFDAGEINIAFE